MAFSGKRAYILFHCDPHPILPALTRKFQLVYIAEATEDTT